MMRKIPIILLMTATLCVPCFHFRSEGQDESAAKQKPFAGWKKPQAALFITGRQHGYLEPCGCTGLDNQKGGLARRHTLLKLFLKKKWAIAPVDTGNQVRRTGVQPELKLHATLEAFRQAKYRAIGFGPDDLKITTNELIQAIVSNADATGKSDMFVSANVEVYDFVPTYRILALGGKKIGITTVLGKEHIKGFKNEEIQVSLPEIGLKAVMPKMIREQCDHLVLLAFTSVDACKALAKQFSQFDFIVSAGGYGEPRYQPEKVEGTKTLIIETGKKGMYVGIVGFFDDPQNPIRYQKLVLDKRFEDSPEMLDVLQEYQNNLQRIMETKGLAGLGIAPVAHPTNRQFVGSETCGDCHTTAYEIWQKTPHHHGTESIVHPPERSHIHRHFDPECLSCHVTGWNPQKFYPYKSGYISLEKSSLLHGVGCENCHGPGSNHVKAENGEGDFTTEQIERFREGMKLPYEKAEQKCMQCHDIDNSPDFHRDGAFERYWKKIEHIGKD